MPVACTETGLPSQRAAEAEHPALGVRLDDVVEIRLGDVLRAQRVAGEEDGLGVVAGLGADVDRHGAQPYSLASIASRTVRQPDARADPRLLRARSRSSASSSRTSRGAGSAASPRSSATARSSRSATSARTSSRPARAAPRSPTRRRAARRAMIIGEEHAVDELWAEARARMPRAARRPAGPARLRARRSRPSRARPGCARRRSADLDAARAGVRGRAPRGDRDRPARPRPGRLPLADARADRGGPLVDLARGRRRSCFKAEASAWTPSAVQLQQVWVDPGGAEPRLREARDARPLPAAARAGARACACSCGPENAPAIRVYEGDRHAAGRSRTAR